MTSSAYKRFAWAIETRTPIVCLYGGRRREICPIILGHTNDEEVALVWQTGGDTSAGPVDRADWKCFRLGKVRNIEVGAGQWRAGLSHQQAQSCVKQVDYDSNPDSPYSPTRSLGDLRTATL